MATENALSKTIELEIQEILVKVVAFISGSFKGPIISPPLLSTWRGGPSRCLESLTKQDDQAALFPPRTAAESARMRRLAKENMSLDPYPGVSESSSNMLPGLRVRNIGNPSTLPPRVHVSASYNSKLKENEKSLVSSSKNLHTTIIRTYRDYKTLAALTGALNLYAIDARPKDPTCSIISSEMMFDTGAQMCITKEDLLKDYFREYLKNDPIHDAYNSSDATMVQVDAALVFSDYTIQMARTFRVVPRSQVPNQRIGIILGQAACINNMVFTKIPRLFLMKDGQSVEDKVWGDLIIHQLVNPVGDIVQLF